MGEKDIWEIEIIIKIDIISGAPDHRLKQNHDPDLLKVELSPLITEDISAQDIFSLKIQFSFPSSGKNTASDTLVNYGVQLINGIISRLAFLANAPIIKMSPPTYTHHYPNTNKFRKIFSPSEQANIHPPKKIDDFGFMTSKIDPRITQALIFSHEALTTSDLIGSFIYLWSSLEILVNLYEIKDFEPKKCSNCGFEFQKKPGIKDSIKYILGHQLSIDDELIEKLWDMRNDIAHHGLTLSKHELIDIEVLRNKLYLINRKLIGLQIGDLKALSNNDIPFSFFSSAVLDIEYTV